MLLYLRLTARWSLALCVLWILKRPPAFDECGLGKEVWGVTKKREKVKSGEERGTGASQIHRVKMNGAN